MQIPLDLLRAFDPVSGEGVVAFVGAGPSTASGLPSWSELLRLLGREFGVLDAIGPALENGRFLDVAQFLLRRRNEAAVQQKIAALIRERQMEPHDLYRLLANVPFRGILTTNYDTLLRASDRRNRYGQPITYSTSNLRSRLASPFLMHLHGHVDDAETIILTRSSYDRYALGVAREARQFLNAISIRHVLLFIGFGFQDPNIDAILREMQDLGVISEWSVFALVPVEDAAAPDPVLHEALAHRAINPIYVTRGSDWGIAAECEWLARLAACVDRLTEARSNPVAATQGPELLQKVQAVLAEPPYRGLLAEALGGLADRPDLDDPARLLQLPAGSLLLFRYVDSRELRQILIFLNGRRNDSRLAEALGRLPPA